MSSEELDEEKPLFSADTIKETTVELAEDEVSQENSDQFLMGFLSALNLLNKKFSQDANWKTLEEEVFQQHEQ